MNNKQLTIIEIIETIEKMELEVEFSGSMQDKRIVFDFGDFSPKELISWRGDYSHLAITYSNIQRTAKHFLSELKAIRGAILEGYKGGKFIMKNETPVWVANWGYSGHTSVTGIIDSGYLIVITTSYTEY